MKTKSYEELATDELDTADKVMGTRANNGSPDSPLSGRRELAKYHVARAQVYATLATGKPA